MCITSITPAAAFWTLCSLLISYLGRPCKSELQKSSLEFMNACTRTSAVVTLIYLRSYISKVVECPFNYIVDMKRHRYGVIENDADITRLICRLDDISSYFNKRKPRDSLNLEQRMKSSVLSVFSFSLLVVIQLVISKRQLSIREIVVIRSTLSSQLKVVYS